MKTTVVLVILALFAVAVSASWQTPEEVPAVMTKPSDNLKKPIIFAPTPAPNTPEADAPIFGVVPEKFKKSAVSENIFGGVVEWTKGRTPQGCRCRQQVPEKYRYDAQFKKERPQLTACGCPVPAPKPEDALPPIIAKLKRERPPVQNVTCPIVKAPVPTKIVPQYYPYKRRKDVPKPCPAPTPAKPVTIQPKFYPTNAERRARRRARRAAKAAAAK
jgi:hypothetical protein